MFVFYVVGQVPRTREFLLNGSGLFLTSPVSEKCLAPQAQMGEEGYPGSRDMLEAFVYSLIGKY